MRMLRLSCKRGNSTVGERQNALDKAITHANQHQLDLIRIIDEHLVDLSGLSHALSTNRPLQEASASQFNKERTNAPSEPQSALSEVYPIAGFQYYDGPRIKTRVYVGDPISLVALTANPYDSHAVAIYWKSFMLGYVPKVKNIALWSGIQSGCKFESCVRSIHTHGGYGAMEIKVKG